MEFSDNILERKANVCQRLGKQNLSIRSQFELKSHNYLAIVPTEGSVN